MSIGPVDVLHFQHPATKMQVSLRIWNLNARGAQLSFNGKVQITAVAARAIAHLTAPDHQFEIDRAVSEFVEIDVRSRIFQRIRILPGCGQQRRADFLRVASIGYTHRDPKPDSRIAIGPVSYRRIDEFTVRHDHGDIVVSHNDRAASADLLNLTGDTRYLHPITDRNRPFRQNNETADKIAGDILQAKSDADSCRSGENGKCGKVNPGV